MEDAEDKGKNLKIGEVYIWERAMDILELTSRF